MRIWTQKSALMQKRTSRLKFAELVVGTCTTTKKNSSNFNRLVLGCIDSYDSEQRRIFQHFSRSTRFAFFCTAPNSKFLGFNLFLLLNFFLQMLAIFADFCKILLKIWVLTGAKECTSCRFRKMLKNAPTLAIVAVHTEENEALKCWGDLFSYLLTKESGIEIYTDNSSSRDE